MAQTVSPRAPRADAVRAGSAPGRKVPSTAGAPAPHLLRRRRLFWPFVLPALALYVVFLVGPAIATLVLSFTRWSGAGAAPEFTGFDQYRQMFASESFGYAFGNTLVYIVVGGVGTFLFAFLFTMVLRNMRAGKTIRAILFFPNIVAPVALGMFFGFVFKYNPSKQGLANFVAQALGLPAAKFLQPENVTWVVIGALIWASAGFYITILMAAVDRIPPYLYEDAELCGASPWQQFRAVTLPLTWDVVGIAGVLWTIGAIKIFEMVFVLAGPGTYLPPNRAWTLAIYVYDRSFGAQGTAEYGVACACAVVMIVLVTVLVLALRRVMRRERLEY
ncbi:carbohydrate ABC transporter permease [Streptosporangium sp. CA-135522]|uniref:carbohydrate ABC transporter permease n=1 Tax=Streptosporangium sp. CA-135522 TaxID=3240072 RepID=UPI003D90699D